MTRLSRSELLQLSQDEPHKPEQRLGAPDETSQSEDEREWNEPEENADPASAVCDDVNGLSLHLHLRSYLGISSIRAVLRTMFRLNPWIRTHVKQRLATWEVSRGLINGTSPSLEIPLSEPTIDEEACINAYFLHVQEITPILDETEFRATWTQGRTDGPWLALLNMVLVLGSISTGTGDDQSHQIYYARAKQYIDLELFGAGCVESLQALCLLGGYYLHYNNSPNMAHAVMGAALRIAVALGLHRDTATPAEPSKASSRPQLRRRLWWSLFCLDTWGSMTLGRPSLGRWDPKTMNVSNAGDSESVSGTLLSLDHSQEFCKIATRVQDRFAQLAPISISDIKSYDLEVETWHRNLPLEFRSLQSCPERLLTPQTFMHNRYFNLRLLLHRPMLLSYADRKVPFSSLQPEEQSVIQSCQDIACSAIDHIADAFLSPNRLRVWNAVWYLYQASMVTVLSIIVDPNNPNISRWRASTEKALQLFQGMAPWTKAADRSREVLASIYEAIELPSNGISEDFDIAGWDQFWFDPFGGDWNWDQMNGFDEVYTPYNLAQ